MIDIERTLRLLDVEAESNFVQAEAIDAINYLLGENARLQKATTPICVGRRIIGLLAGEGAWTSENGASVVAADELFRNDPYDEITRLHEENARLRSILSTKVRPPFDDDLAGEPYAAEDRQPEPGGLGRVGQVEGGGEDGGA